MGSRNFNISNKFGQMDEVKLEKGVGGGADDSGICSTSSITPAPLSRQFWRAGNYDDNLTKKPTTQNGTSYLRIHPKFLHSNATSHKWAFGAMAELLDNSVDEIQNGATFVNVDKTLNPRDGSPALLVQDDGGGMEPAAMRRCISFGFSDKNVKTSIGQYGNGFKTSSMRLGADVIVFSRHMKNSKWTQSVGLLSYTFLMKTQQDRIVVPMIDYLYNEEAGTWKTIHQEQHVQSNLAILLQCSPFTTEAELLNQCDDIGRHGTKIIVYNLWHNDDGKLELDFDTDPEDICLSKKSNDENRKKNAQTEANERHLGNRLQYSLRAYLSILYLRVPANFAILLRGRLVEYHNIANGLKYPQFIMYRPQHVQGEVITTIGFVKEAPAVNVHGFNVYHKNRLILPFWHVVTFSDSRGRGVVGVLEANFIEPIHNKQDFEKTPVFQKLETRLREMTQEYWDYHCGLIGYLPKKKPQPMTDSSVATQAAQRMFHPVVLGRDSSGFIGAKVSPSGVYEQEMNAFENHVAKRRNSKPPHLNSQGAPPKRKRHDDIVKSEKVGNTGILEPITTDIAPTQNIQPVHDLADQLEDEDSIHIIEENKRLHTQCKEYEKGQEELNQKVTDLMAEIKETRREYARLLLDSKLLEKAKQGSRPVT